MKTQKSFRERLKNNQNNQNNPAEINLVQKSSWDQTLANFSQVAMLIVVIFGYLFTVRPIYLKEKLEEEKAKLELQSLRYRKEISQLQSQVAPLKQERVRLEYDQKKLLSEIAGIEKRKEELENQMDFMSFRFLFPDGSPAKTHEQVQEVLRLKEVERKANEKEIKRKRLESARQNYFFNFKLNTSWRMIMGSEKYPFKLYLDVSRGEKSYPFNQDELRITRDKNVGGFIIKVALQSLEQHHKRYVSGDETEYDFDSWKSHLSDKLSNSKVTVKNIHLVQEIIDEYQKKEETLRLSLERKLKEVDKEFDGWEDTWNSYKKEILRHNYTVSKARAKTEYRSELFKLQNDVSEKANKVRKEVSNSYNALIKSLPGELSL